MARSVGRPTKATPALIKRAHEYADGSWKEFGDAIPMVEGLADFLDVSKDFIYTHDVFSDVLAKIKYRQARTLQNKGLEGKYSAVITKLLLSAKHDVVEKTATDHTTKGKELPAPILGGLGNIPGNNSNTQDRSTTEAD